MPKPGQTIHPMSWRDMLRTLWDMHRREGRNIRELKLYTTDDLRRLYQASSDEPIKLRDGIVSRVQLVAVIRWRVLWGWFGYIALLLASLAAAMFAFLAWRFPASPPK